MATKNGKARKDLLSICVIFLQKRDGTDKVLKILRYSAKLWLALAASSASTPYYKRLKSFESSVGASRKALRIGKFLQDVEALRELPPLGSVEGVLSLTEACGEGVYYFIEQFVWLVKAGVIDPRHSSRLGYVSAWAELIGYIGSIPLKTMQVVALEKKMRVAVQTRMDKLEFHQKRQLENEKSGKQNLLTLESIPSGTDAVVLSSTETQLRSSSWPGAANAATVESSVTTCTETAQNSAVETQENAQECITLDCNLARELTALQHKQRMKMLSLIQDIADALLAVHDILDEMPLQAKAKPSLRIQPSTSPSSTSLLSLLLWWRHPSVLAAAGLLSALISAHKNWATV